MFRVYKKWFVSIAIVRMFVYTMVFKIKLRIIGSSFGSGLVVDGRVLIKSQFPKRIIIGENLKINSSPASNLVGVTNCASFQIIDNGKIEIGNYCGFSSTVFSSRSLIKIGDFVNMGGNVRIFDHDYHSLEYLDRRDKSLDGKNCKTEPVIVGNDVFIGTNSIILKGVNIGDRSIIGAGSVVLLKEIPSDCIIAGNPAKIIKRDING